MIEIRKQNPAFGLGTYTELPSSNPAVLAFLREYEDDLVLCVNNFARFAQPTELDLREFADAIRSSCSAGSASPPSVTCRTC
ncbi:Trehalose synthase/amylase TreS [Streptomyces sp. MH60]|nr:Trehalose synthase/amylase TreS [Streptomyces sp. MH60]